jgi:FKBP-type peptidyl-prolyl cis-trans isomerase
MKFLYLLLLLIVFENCTPRLIKTKSGLQYLVLKKGKGKIAKTGDEILLFETTRYKNGTVLYSNENSKSPVKVKIGANQATDAVDEALRGMKAGEIREIIAPPYLVRRKSYPPNISPDSTLVIKLHVHKISKDVAK